MFQKELLKLINEEQAGKTLYILRKVILQESILLKIQRIRMQLFTT